MAKQTGPHYDGTVKALCALRPDVLCDWLGLPVSTSARAVRLSESVPPVTRQVDVLVAVDDAVAVHLEFQTAGEARFAHRMLDYRLRLTGQPELAERTLFQHVIVLGPGSVAGGLTEEGLSYRYDVHYLRDQPVEPLLADPHLAPFAPLARLPDGRRADILCRALDLIATVADPATQRVLAQAAVDLAALYLSAATIDQAWEVSTMPIPSLLQRKYEEGVERGLEQGLERGLVQAAASLLRVRFGEDDRIDDVARRLAPLGADVYVRRIDAAASLDDLTGA